MKTQVERVLQDAQDELFLKHLDPKRHFESVGKAMLGDIVGMVFPAAGTVSAILEASIDEASKRRQRWQGFLVGSRRAVRRSLR